MVHNKDIATVCGLIAFFVRASLMLLKLRLYNLNIRQVYYNKYFIPILSQCKSKFIPVYSELITIKLFFTTMNLFFSSSLNN